MSSMVLKWRKLEIRNDGKTIIPVKKSEIASDIRYTACPFINFLLVQKTIRTVRLESVVATAKTTDITKKMM